MIKKYLKERIYTSILLIILLILISNFDPLLLMCILILGVLSLLEFLNITKKLFRNKIYFIFSNFFFIIYFFIFCFLFLFFSNILKIKIILFSLLYTCIVNIGGFIFGKIFKGPNLQS